MLWQQQGAAAGRPHAKLTQLTSPFRISAALKARAAGAQIVDIAGWDAWPYARWARKHRPHQLVVSRSNGLWCRARPNRAGDERGAARRAVGAVVQAELCRWERTSIREAELAAAARGAGPRVNRRLLRP